MSANSKLFVTSTGGQTPYVPTKADGESFKVKIDAPVGVDIDLDWLIIN